MKNRRKPGRRTGDYLVRYLLITSLIAHAIIVVMAITGCISPLSDKIPLDSSGTDGEADAEGGTVTIPVTGVKIDDITVKAGESKAAVIRIVPSDASIQRVS
jgi:hypothetical protein